MGLKIVGPHTGRWAAALALDTASVVVFAAVGRRSHDEANGIAHVLGTAAPFLVALAAGWIAAIVLGLTRDRFADPIGVDAGTVIWIVTVAIGLLARRVLWDRGTAVAFVVVAAAFLASTLVGWRAARAWWRTRGMPA